MAVPKNLQDRISTLTKRLRQCANKIEGLHAAQDDEFENLRNGEFLNIFRDTCAMVRESETGNPPYQLELVEAAQNLLNEAIGIAYEAEDMFDFMPSWAHDDQSDRPLIEDRHGATLALRESSLASVSLKVMNNTLIAHKLLSALKIPHNEGM